jgi:hypothetical protein
VGLETIDLDSWGKKPPESPKKKAPPAVDGTARPARPKKEPREGDAGHVRVKPVPSIPLDEVPIDALRGLYYLIVGMADKKQSKTELQRNLKALLSTPETCKKLMQGIANIVDTELVL